MDPYAFFIVSRISDNVVTIACSARALTEDELRQAVGWRKIASCEERDSSFGCTYVLRVYDA